MNILDTLALISLVIYLVSLFFGIFVMVKIFRHSPFVIIQDPQVLLLAVLPVVNTFFMGEQIYLFIKQYLDDRKLVARLDVITYPQQRHMVNYDINSFYPSSPVKINTKEDEEL